MTLGRRAKPAQNPADELFFANTPVLFMPALRGDTRFSHPDAVVTFLEMSAPAAEE
jgi:hypothetical protein